MSKSLQEYDQNKSNAITTAKRLGEFLGDQYIQGKGLTCQYVICKEPRGSSVTQRSIPIIIFSENVDEKQRIFFLKKWMKTNSVSDFSVHNILDWDYYLERFTSTVQKIITIPAAMQQVANPIPSMPYPEWLQKQLNQLNDPKKQRKITDTFTVIKKSTTPALNDIENLPHAFSKPKVISQPTLNIKSTKRILPENKASSQKETQVVPDRKKNYQAWLQYQKQKWRNERLERKKKALQRFDSNFLSEIKPGKKYLVTNYEEKKKFEMVSSTWKVVEVIDQGTDKFDVWMLFKGFLKKISIIVPKTFYLNTLTENFPSNPLFSCSEKVVKHLPRSFSLLNLFKVTMQQSSFDEFQMWKDHLLLDLDFEIYESNISLFDRLLIEIGGISFLNNPENKEKNREKNLFSLLQLGRDSSSDYKSIPSQNTDNLISIEEKEMIHKKINQFNYHYLTPSEIKNNIFLIHTSNANRSKGSYCIFVPKELTQNNEDSQYEYHSYFFICESKKMDTEKLGNHFTKKNPLTENITKRFQKLSTAEQKVNQVLKSLIKDAAPKKSNKKKKLSEMDDQQKFIFITIQSQVEKSVLRELLPVLNEVPIVSIPFFEETPKGLEKNSDKEIRFAEMINKNFKQHNLYLMSQLEISSFSNLPIANVSSSFRYVLDVLFARFLQNNNGVLWWNNSQFPDLGSQTVDPLYTEMFQNVQVCNPDFYNNFSVSFDIRHLAISAILSPQFLKESQISLLFSTNDSSNTNKQESNQISNNRFDRKERLDDISMRYNDSVDCNKALVLIQNFVKKLLLESAEENGSVAKTLLMRVYEWISSSDSYLYEKSIHHHLFQSMKQIFMLLLEQFEKLGSKVIYASNGKIIISTNKRDESSASEYCNFVLKQISSDPTFEYIQIIPNTYWKVLLFKDIFNYAGVVSSSSSLLIDQESDSTENMEINFKIADHFPDPVKKLFSYNVQNFLELLTLYSKKQKKESLNINLDTSDDLEIQKAKKDLDQEDSFEMIDEEDSKLSDPESKLISDEYASKLFEIVYQMNKSGNNFLQDKSDRNNASTSSSSVVLDFIKTLTHVLSLNKTSELEVFKLKKNLLKIISVEDFSHKAEFVNPCQNFSILHVCEICAEGRDFELLGDESNHTKNWKCPVCLSAIHKDKIEKKLIEMIHIKSYAYSSQDLVCSKCKLINNDPVADICNVCAGYFVPTIPPVEIQSFLQTMSHISSFHKFNWLGEVVNFHTDLF